MKTKTLVIVGIISLSLLLLCAVSFPYIFPTQTPEPEESLFKIIKQPTDFARIGTIVFNNPGLEQGIPYLVYEEPGSPAMTLKLIIDELSVCGASNGAVPCMAMSVTFDVPFHGKRASIEGIKSDAGVIVRKLQVVEEGQLELNKDPGDIFISWMHARSLIKNCEVSMLMQTHALDVYLNLKDGTRVRAVEPVIDEVFRVYDESMSQCGTIPVATE